MIEKYVIDIRFIILEFFWLNIQARWNEKNYGGGEGREGLGVYPKNMLPKLISWLRRSFNWYRLKCTEILNREVFGDVNSQDK